MADVLQLDLADHDDRFARFRLISWWDQHRLASARVLVIGAGALGNEIIKNLALLGAGNVLIADRDRIEQSNLSRCVLFRESDCDRGKAAIAADRARELFPAMQLQSFEGNIVYDLGLGVYRWADVILAGMDNREARVAINRAAAKVGKPWIDGAIERLDGVARVFDPATGPCYECTMSDIDWKMLEARRSCALLSRDEIAQGKVPTTPTTSSVIAGIEVQEALKMLHGMPTIAGQGFVFDGTSYQNYLVTYSRLDECPSHDAIGPILSLPGGAADTRVGDLLERARADLGPTAILEFNQDLLDSLLCPACNRSYPLMASLGKVTESQGRCPTCGEPCAPQIYHSVGAGSTLLNKTLAELGVPLWDIVIGRAGATQQGYELTGDREQVLGPLASTATSGESSPEQGKR